MVLSSENLSFLSVWFPTAFSHKLVKHLPIISKISAMKPGDNG